MMHNHADIILVTLELFERGWQRRAGRAVSTDPIKLPWKKALAEFFLILGMAPSGSSVFVLPRFNLCTHDCGGSLPKEAEQSPNPVPDQEILREISHSVFYM